MYCSRSGLLGGHVAAVALMNAGKGLSWYKGELLVMANDVGYRLLPAFNTSTGIPYPRVSARFCYFILTIRYS